ncbi:flagellar biosynthesis protein FlhB [Planctomycetota bacterium]
MAEHDTGQEKNEAPTQLRREKARRKGQVANSADLTNGVLLLGGLYALKYTAPSMASKLMAMLRDSAWTMNRSELGITEVPFIFQAFLQVILSVCLPLVAIALVMALCTSLGQVGMQVSSESLAIDWSKLSPAKGAKKLFSLRSVMRSMMMLLKMAASIGVAFWLVKADLEEIRSLGFGSFFQVVTTAWDISFSVAISLSLLYLTIGAIDYSFQRFQHEKDLRMSKQEIRDETKEQEGDANVKARIRKLQRESAKQVMLRQVPTASVVLTNPTHYAVALRYERNSRGAPIVVAKGTDAFARRIAKIARENGVTVLERKPLARALYAMVEVNQEIPPQLYRAIAEILAFVYGLRRPNGST